jgi:hypothetical protein
MHTLHSLLSNLKEEFASSKKGEERGAWFVYTSLAIILPFTSSKTSGLVRALESVFGFAGISQKRYYIHVARWKIEAGFKELKRELGSAETQTRNPVSVMTVNIVPWLFLFLVTYCTDKSGTGPTFKHKMIGFSDFLQDHQSWGVPKYVRCVFNEQQT